MREYMGFVQTGRKAAQGQQIDDSLSSSLVENYWHGIGPSGPHVKQKPLLKVYVPEWKGHVYIRELSVADREAHDLEWRNSGNKLKNFRAKFLVRCLCDKKGERLFTDADAVRLGERRASAMVPLWEKAMQHNQSQVVHANENGYPLPPDLEAVIDRYAAEDKTANPQEKKKRQDCFRQGFFLALLRYADELKSHPEVAAMRAAFAHGRKKAAELKRKEAEPERNAIRKRFRELRKSGFTKTGARNELVQPGTKSLRQIERDTKGLS